jgi:hypothetical protein
MQRSLGAVSQHSFAATSQRSLAAMSLAIIFALTSAAARPARAQTGCGAAVLEGIPDRLRAIEVRRVASAGDALGRAQELSAIVADPALAAAVAPCPADAGAAPLTAVARQRLLVLWAKMLALDAVDMPVYATPYDRRCAGVDGATWQTAFIRAYVERLDGQGSEVTRPALRQALDADALAPHVKDLVAARAGRLRIGALPGPDSDEAQWLQNNELARSKALAALKPGVRCGPLPGAMALAP